MQRLTTRLRRRAGDERGATAVLVSLLLVPMLGFAAIAVDVGALYAERARLQIAADAAALAVAQDCARGNCGDMLATARALVTANDGEASAAQPVLSSDPLSVTVEGSTPKEHWFAPVIGHDSTAVSAVATVGWGGPSGGTSVLPLIFSWCSFQAQTNGGLPSTTTKQTIMFSKSDDGLRVLRAVRQRGPRWLRVGRSRPRDLPRHALHRQEAALGHRASRCRGPATRSISSGG